MVSPVKREAEILMPPLQRAKLKPKQTQARKHEMVKWFYRLSLSFLLLLAWCLVHYLTLMETKACNWHKSQIAVKEAQVRRLQVLVAQRLSELAGNPPRQPERLNLLSLDRVKREQSLLGRR